MELVTPSEELKLAENIRNANLKRRTLLRDVFRALHALHQLYPGGCATHFRIENAGEELLMGFEADVAGQCEQCRVHLVRGEQGHVCLDGDPVFCAEHALTWADVKESYEVDGGVLNSDPERYAAFIAELQKYTDAGGAITDKLLHTL